MSAAVHPTQPLQVTVPPGVQAGMMFQVNAPTGPVQVACPDGASEGSVVLVQVPALVQAAVVPQVMAGRELSEEEIHFLSSGTAKLAGSYSGTESMGCIHIAVTWKIDPFTDGKYPYTSLTKVTCCGCCPIANVTSTGELSGDGTTWRSKSDNGTEEQGMISKVDIPQQQWTYAVTGFQPRGPVVKTHTVDLKHGTHFFDQTAPQRGKILLKKQ